jgi:hypothetical protein
MRVFLVVGVALLATGAALAQQPSPSPAAPAVGATTPPGQASAGGTPDKMPNYIPYGLPISLDRAKEIDAHVGERHGPDFPPISVVSAARIARHRCGSGHGAG